MHPFQSDLYASVVLEDRRRDARRWQVHPSRRPQWRARLGTALVRSSQRLERAGERLCPPASAGTPRCADV